MWIVESIDIRLIYERQIENILSKCMSVETHLVVAFHFCAHFISLSCFSHLLIIFCSHLKHLYSIDRKLNKSKYALVDADVSKSKYSLVSKLFKTFENWNADRVCCDAKLMSVLFFLFLFFISFNFRFSAFNRFFSSFWSHEQQHV